MITSDFKQKINDISVQYYVELSWDTEKKRDRTSTASSVSRLNGEIEIS